MNVRYTATALDEIEDILTHIARDNSSAALKVSVTILATINRVAEFPHTAIEANVPGVTHIRERNVSPDGNAGGRITWLFRRSSG